MGVALENIVVVELIITLMCENIIVIEYENVFNLSIKLANFLIN
jgi:hypothetical protein